LKGSIFPLEIPFFKRSIIFKSLEVLLNECYIFWLKIFVKKEILNTPGDFEILLVSNRFLAATGFKFEPVPSIKAFLGAPDLIDFN